MDNLSQNELLSAYLDGELSAAERADVERMLANDPAARRLLDELRSLSTMLQALPPQKLGEDLSDGVLRAARQRMQDAGDAEANKPSPMSSPRSWLDLRRFVNRQSVLWTGLAIAIAIVISVNERNQHQPNKEVATRGRTESSSSRLAEPTAKMEAATNGLAKQQEGAWTRAEPKKSGELPSIRALADSSEKSDKSLPSDLASPEVVKPSMPKEHVIAKKVAGKSPYKYESAIDREAQDGPRVDVVQKPAALGRVAKAPAYSGVSPSVEQPMSKAGGAVVQRKVNAYFGKAGPKDGKQREVAALDMLVVYCDITPEAAANKSLVKLLDANGIAWRREAVERNKADYDRLQNDAKSVGQGPQDQKPAPVEKLDRVNAEGDAELVYAEATEAQVHAALAGLQAQPKVFLSYSIQSATNDDSQLRFERIPAKGEKGQTRGGDGALAVGRDKDGLSSSAAEPAMTPPAATPQATTPLTATPLTKDSSELKRQAATSLAKPSVQPQRFGSQAGTSEGYARAESRRQVLFVLRIAGDAPPVAAARASKETGADASKAAKSATEPAKERTPSK